MKKIITVNLSDNTFDVELHGISLNRIRDLSTISDDVAENLKSTLMLLGADYQKVDKCISLLLQGKCDIQYILEVCL